MTAHGVLVFFVRGGESNTGRMSQMSQISNTHDCGGDNQSPPPGDNTQHRVTDTHYSSASCLIQDPHRAHPDPLLIRVLILLIILIIQALRKRLVHSCEAFWQAIVDGS